MTDETYVERDEPAREEEDSTESGIVIPWERLSEGALRGVIEEFVTREGTEYGDHDVSLDDKVRDVQRQLERRDVVVLFDVKTEAVNLVRAREVRHLLQD
jgi:uncharacterized protein YheU (UPF0270 family)